MDIIRRHNQRSPGSNRVTRRAALQGMAGAGIATTVGLAHAGGVAADHMHPEPKSSVSSASKRTQAPTSAPLIEPAAGFWKTWVLKRGDQLRPDAPPNPEQTRRELTELHRLAVTRTPEMWDRISYWDAGSPGYRWNEEAMQLTRKAGYGPGDAYRVMALLNVAIYDATIACWDAKYAYHRARPAAGDQTLQTAIQTPASPAYPCEHAVTAGAASTVLAYLFPEEAQTLSALADEASRSRMEAGVAHESDITTGLKLGKHVGDLVVAYAKADGSDAVFDPATMPSGPGIWTGDPVYPMLGTWKTWVLTSGSQFRPGPPPAWDSPERAAEIAEVKNYARDSHPFTELFFWPDDPSGRPAPDSVPISSNEIVFYYAPVLHFLWGPELAKKLFEYRWDANPPRSARAYALVSIAGFDATVACWDAKFHYWTARPNQFDPSITTVLPTYPIPDYPSGHAATLGGTSEMLAYLFPREAHVFRSRAEENAASRVWAGIHFRSACEAGFALGRQVAAAVIEQAMNDGSSDLRPAPGKPSRPY